MRLATFLDSPCSRCVLYDLREVPGASERGQEIEIDAKFSCQRSKSHKLVLDEREKMKGKKISFFFTRPPSSLLLSSSPPFIQSLSEYDPACISGCTR
jgi:hypothetical protein